jgi:hypothetical protein
MADRPHSYLNIPVLRRVHLQSEVYYVILAHGCIWLSDCDLEIHLQVAMVLLKVTVAITILRNNNDSSLPARFRCE